MFFFNDTATTEIYTLSLHDALPIYFRSPKGSAAARSSNRRHSSGSSYFSTLASALRPRITGIPGAEPYDISASRSEEHTSELQSRQYLVCRLLLEKKQNINTYIHPI